MTETEAAPSAPAITTSPKKGKAAGKKKAAGRKPTHPPTAQMVNSAIQNLKERGGSSLQAIKKYISMTYKVDADKMSTFIKKYLVKSVETGKLIQTKGKGAAGSFKLAGRVSGGEEKRPSPKKPKVKAPIKRTGEKKAKAAPKKKEPTVKAKRVKKPPTKPKAPKPKKATARPAKSPKPKKAAPAKRKVAAPKKK